LSNHDARCFVDIHTPADASLYFALTIDALQIQPSSHFEIINHPTVKSAVFTLQFDKPVYAQLADGRKLPVTDIEFNQLRAICDGKRIPAISLLLNSIKY
jgi:hypothetical protein